MAFEKELIIKQMNDVITYSQSLNHSVDCTNLFNQLLEAKSYFINLFNGELIYEYPEEVSFELNEEDKKARVRDFCTTIENKYSEYELSEFVYSQSKYFFSNRVGETYTMEDGTIVPKGMKLLRAFKYFVSDSTLLDKLQNMASMVIQEDKITGTLCFSVHPLDFLSSSENNHNWRSCHALDGEYRAGNLSYMLDSATFMVYLRSKEEAVLPNFPFHVKWNNKKWRCLLFLNDKRDMVFAGRQYPFASYEGLEFVKTVLSKSLPSFGEWTKWQNNKIRSFEIKDDEASGTPLYSPYVQVGRKLRSLKEIVQDNAHVSTPLHFNDILKSSCYDPVYAYKTKKAISLWSDIPRCDIITSDIGVFKIGSDVICPCCNKQNVEISETLVCTDCEVDYGSNLSDVFGICDCCGRRYYYDDGYYIDLAEQDVCPDCYDRYYGVCACCGDSGYLGEDIFYDNQSGEYYCRWCRGDR